MFKQLSKAMVKMFGSRNERLIKSYMTVAEQAGQYEPQIQALDDEALKQKTAQFKAQIAQGTQAEQLLPEAFAVVREAAKRNVAMRHFDVQLIGGHVLYEGNIAEMATGEGKTLMATLATYLLYLTDKKVHVVTVNDYLAKRDAEWMAPVYRALGLTVGAIQADMDTSGEERRAQYGYDVTYGTNNEFGFDYLRDNMKTSMEQMAQGPLHYALIDEVDSILVDEARTPLIISGPAHDDVTRYKRSDQVARKLITLHSEYDSNKKRIDASERSLANAQGELADAKKAKASVRIEAAQKAIDQSQRQLDTAQAQLEQATQYYEVEADKKSAHMTHDGVGAAQEIAGIGSFFTGSNMEWPHLIEQSLRAHVVYEREKEYVVLDGKVVIVDEFTGRLMQGRQWSDGLHQAVEAKEGVTIKQESQTLATITLQNFFKLYEKIGGMTGTAETEAEEFMRIYNLDVVVIPTNEPNVRDDRDDLIYQTVKDKFGAIAEEIHEVSDAGRPVLVGTISIEKSEALSAVLTKRFAQEHEVLNAKQHAREATIVTKAGHQFTGRDGKKRGNVTIATNMAGRGTDIKLGEGVADLGGLHILGTERHEARRIDNQLRGRAGRQGDLGSSQFFLSFEDDLMRIFAPEQTVKLLSLIGWQEGEPIHHKRISKGIEKAQKKVEERNYEIRKSLLEYDEVMDYQRKTFYARRKQILEGRELKNMIQDMIQSTIEDNCTTILDKCYARDCVIDWARTEFDVELKIPDLSNVKLEDVETQIKDKAKDDVTNKISLSLGEYLEDFEDPKTWNIQGLSKWAMSAFQVSLTPGKIKDMSYEEIETTLVEAACEQVDKKDCSQAADFLEETFALKRLAEWAKTKFELQTDVAQLKAQSQEQIQAWLLEKTQEKYERREIEYPVEFAMSMVYAQQEPNVYAFETLSDWIQTKYQRTISSDQLQHMTPKAVHKELLQLSEAAHQGKLEQDITDQVRDLQPEDLVAWVNERFKTSLTIEDLSDNADETTQRILAMAKTALRTELRDLEKYVLLQVYDGTWKDHLRTMDHLKDSIWMRSFAEKDPKTEYKREGYALFNQMLTSIEDRVTDIIFKIHLEAGMRSRNVWNISNAAHDQVGQFAMAEQQRAAAQAPQGEVQVKQIKLDQPKVGRNDPCPCGSGKKFKKCCGKEG
jgi:preprotein translocase subunit SecA